MKLYLKKLPNNQYAPLDEYDFDESKKVKVGDVIEVKQTRNYQFHKKAFAVLNIGFENQDTFKSFEVYRNVMTIKAGYYQKAPTKDGSWIPVADSLSYEKMSKVKFDQFYKDLTRTIAEDLSISVEDLTGEINYI